MAETRPGPVWRIQTPAGFIVPGMIDVDAERLAQRYAKMMGQTWEELRAKGYQRFHWKRGAEAYPYHTDDVRAIPAAHPEEGDPNE